MEEAVSAKDADLDCLVRGKTLPDLPARDRHGELRPRLRQLAKRRESVSHLPTENRERSDRYDNDA